MGRCFLISLCGFLLVVSSATAFDMEGDGRKEFEYWPDGNYKSFTLFDESGRVKAKAYCGADGTVEKVERFDIYGNRIQEAFYDGEGRLKTGIDGWAAMRWWYDGSQLVSQISYDEDGRTVDRRQYSDSGRLIYRQYSPDADLNPYEEANMYMLAGLRNEAYYNPEAR